ncbi:hypothetical protein ACHAQA_007290 [Verticillium albo-atrum]
MAPARQPDNASFAKDERVLCFHHEMLYEAKVLDIQPPETENDVYQYRVHYKGWKNTWDDWVAPDRIRKFTESNKELAAQLHAQMKNLQKSTSKVPKKIGRPNGTESARGSEERGASLFATGRGPRRTRDYELETLDTKASRASDNISPNHYHFTITTASQYVPSAMAQAVQGTGFDNGAISNCAATLPGQDEQHVSGAIFNCAITLPGQDEQHISGDYSLLRLEKAYIPPKSTSTGSRADGVPAAASRHTTPEPELPSPSPSADVSRFVVNPVTLQSPCPASQGGLSAQDDGQPQYSEDEETDDEYDLGEMPKAPSPPPAPRRHHIITAGELRQARREEKQKQEAELKKKYPDTYDWAKYICENMPSRDPAEMERSRAEVEKNFAATEHTLWDTVDWSQIEGAASFEREMSPGGTLY